MAPVLETKIDRVAFEASVICHLDAAYSLARWLARNGPDAEDIVQESVLRALRFFGGFRGGDAKVWLLAIVRNTFYTQRVASKATSTDTFDEDLHTVIDEAPDPEAVLLRASDTKRLHEALDGLPAEHREILVLRELEEYSYKEIAAITGLRMGTVMSRLARARERLARSLSDPVTEEGRHELR